MYYGFEYYPVPPPPPRKPTAAILAAQLLDAVYAQDMDGARKVFDTAFWEKIELKPDAFTLLQAALKGDRPMTVLLTSYGAAFTPDEAMLAKKLAGEKNWAHIEGPLKQAGIKTRFTPQEERRGDILTAVKWAHRTAAEAKARGKPEAVKAELELQALLSVTLVEDIMANNIARARDLLLYRDPKLGDGREGNPLDVAAEFRAVERRYPLSNGRAGLQLLDRLTAAGLAVKPLILEQGDMMFASGLPEELAKRGLLGGSTANARRDALHRWLGYTRHIRLGERDIDLGADFTAQRQAELKSAVLALFAKNPPDEADAEWFIRRHATALKETPALAATVEKELLANGFFDAPAWTPARLRQLAAAGPEFALTPAFNTRAAHRELSATALPKLLNAKKFPLVIEAMTGGAGVPDGGWKPDAADTVRILDYLHGETRKTGMTPEADKAVAALRRAGADFSAVDANNYLGRKEPGLAKALLDAGLVAAKKFNLDKVLDRTGDLETSLPRFDAGNKYAEFLFQLLLEQIDPEKYIPLRGAAAKNYQRLFVGEWVTRLEPKFRGKLPPAPPRRPGTGSTGPR
ncbi:MAG TPA: hypothetical protein VEF76_14345 [Patescibacteria group bacterium]|nr:hypothetical protein [Patescibacteria group bacterium]